MEGLHGRHAVACLHPAPGAEDSSHKTPQDQYATRRNPVVYFRSIIDSTSCAGNDVDYNQLSRDLGSVAATPNLAYISPNVCHDGHDKPCSDGTPRRPGSCRSMAAHRVPPDPVLSGVRTGRDAHHHLR